MQVPTQAQVRAFYGEPGNPDCTAGMVDLAYPMKIAWDLSSTVNRFRCHKKCEVAFENIFKNTLAHYGLAKVQALSLDIFGGCYNLRQMRGGTSWSMHSWGIACDLDPEHNQLKQNKSTAKFAKAEYEAFWKIVEAEGAVSLGRAKDYDWMHFQFARL